MGPVRKKSSASPISDDRSDTMELGLDVDTIASCQPSPDSTTSPGTLAVVTVAKCKHSEKRREHWRIAVRKRRTAEAGALQDIRDTLPVPLGVLKPLNQLSVLRIAVCYVRLRSMLKCLRLQAQAQGSDSCESVPPLLESLGMDPESLLPDGFLIILSTTGDVIYVSDNGSTTFRSDKYAVLGTSLYDYIHEADADELAQLLSVKEFEGAAACPGASGPTTFKSLRSSATVALRGGSGSRIRITGKVFLDSTAMNMGIRGSESFFVGVAEPLSMPDPLDYEFPFPQLKVHGTFNWVTTADMKTCLHVSPDSFLGYSAADFPTDMGPFEFFHPEDLPRLREDSRKLFTHGEHQFQPYRCLARYGGWAWFISQASIMVVQTRQSDGSLKPVTLCAGRDFMISDVEEPDQILATIQMGIIPSSRSRGTDKQTPPQPQPCPPSPSDPLSFVEDVDCGDLDLDLDLDALVNLIGENDDYDTENSNSVDELFASLGSDTASDFCTRSASSDPQWTNFLYNGAEIPDLNSFIVKQFY